MNHNNTNNDDNFFKNYFTAILLVKTCCVKVPGMKISIVNSTLP